VLPLRCLKASNDIAESFMSSPQARIGEGISYDMPEGGPYALRRTDDQGHFHEYGENIRL
jgi:hypothetical protein